MAGGIDPFNLAGGNKRGRPELGFIDPSGIVAYPVTNEKNVEGSEFRYKTLREPTPGQLKQTSSIYDRGQIGQGVKAKQKHNASIFRNLSRSPFLSPGFDQSQGRMKDNTAIMSLEGFPKHSKGRQTIGVTNVAPMNKPRYIIDRKAQLGALTGNRQRLATGAGVSSPETTEKLFSGVLEGLGSEFQLVRNKFGDPEVVDMGGKELPTIMYSQYDLIDDTIREKKKRWALNNRRFRTDTGQVWRDTFPEKVTGGIDPLLRLPNEFYMEELGDKFADRWINHTDREGHTYEGVPIPPNFAPNRGELGLDRAILTTRGFHFLPEWANNRFQPILDAAMVGDVIRSEEDCFDDAWSVAKEVRYSEGGMHSCPQCEGRGQVQFTENDPQGNPINVNFITCPSCSGSGQMTSEDLIAQKDSDDDWCSCPEYNGMAHDRFGNQVRASPEQIQDWKDGVMLVEDEDEEGPYSYTVCGTCNGMVSAG